MKKTRYIALIAIAIMVVKLLNYMRIDEPNFLITGGMSLLAFVLTIVFAWNELR